MTARGSLVALVLGLVAPLAMAGGCDKCKKNEEPLPLPTTEAEAPTTPETSLEPEDAGEDVDDAGDADADAAKKTGVLAPASSFKKCCDALASAAANAPPDQKLYYMQAAAMCSGAVTQSKDKSTIVGMVLGVLKGAALPAACK
jgi:hypothetical protein